MEIIVKQSYNHINSSFKRWDTPIGRRIKNKSDYERAMKEEGMVTCEEAQANIRKNKEYNLSKDAENIIRAAKNRSNNGKLKLSISDGLVIKMIDKGIIKPKGYGMEHLPAHLQRSV